MINVDIRIESIAFFFSYNNTVRQKVGIYQNMLPINKTTN